MKASESSISPRPFLESVARAYHDRYEDLSEVCFVFPNKRSGTFFLKHLRDCSQHTVVAPFVTSITDFVARLSDHDVASRVDLLFRLYNIYREMKGSGSPDSGPEGEKERTVADFDSFRNWGEILLSDFSEVDQYDVDADSLFKNVKDYREISSDFLTDEQKQVMERYFGYTPGVAEVRSFWKHLQPPSDIKNKFLLLWQQMSPLYHALNESLGRERLCTSGNAYRLALRRLRGEGAAIVPWRKVVMVGFNALSTTEALIFEELKMLGLAEFYWDGTGPVLSGAVNDAATFLKYNRRNFPSPQWAAPYLAESDTSDLPARITSVAAPSNSAQAKIAGEKVRELLGRLGADDIREAKVAVVLPDENLLMPLLYSLPRELEEVNLTMGYPLRNTSVMSFVYHLRRLLRSCRRSGKDREFYHEDLHLLLSHPYSHALLGSDTISAFNGYIGRLHKITVTFGELLEFSPLFADLLYPLPADARVEQTVGYLEDVLVRISVALDEGNEEGILKSRLDRSHIEVYRDALHRLAAACRRHNVEMGVQGVFSMVDKLLAGEQVTFEGEPLEGLQVMGLLETRALDFEHLVILSMNDKIMPRKASGRTFIPDSLRHGFGLPYSNYREDLFSYYFYRMISRAKEVTLIHDARAGEGMRSGGMSRYLMQLRYLYGGGRMHYENHKFLLNPPENEARPVEKSDMVMRQLEEFTVRDSKRNLSASALRNYFQCQVKFYYENVQGIKSDPENSEYIDAIELGNIYHEVMFHLYFPEGSRNVYLDKPILVTEGMIDALLADREGLMRMVVRAINRLHFHRMASDLDAPVDGAAEIVAGHIADLVCDTLRYDRRLAPFRLLGGEISGIVEWPLRGSDRRVNIKYAIDRLDIVKGADGVERHRIVDYKTGDAHVKASSVDAIFGGEMSSKNLFQLMLYANLMNRDRGSDESVRLSIYQVSDILRSGEVVPQIGIPGDKRITYKPLYVHKDINEEFLETTDNILADIFDREKPFLPADDDESCRYCRISHLCGRNLS